jgi:CubicO group peptidase (beta-lactamase class C family)
MGPLGGDVDAEVVQAQIADTIGEHEATDITQAIVVVHRGKVVAEAYGPDTHAATPLISWSMAKSITHALVGIAQMDGLLDVSKSAPVDAWKNDDRSQITLQHLLDMRSGLSWNEDYVDGDSSDVIEMLFGSGKDDVAAYAVSLPLAEQPDSRWLYSSGTTNIVARILGNAYGDRHGSSSGIERVLQQRLFAPIGMHATARFDAAGTFIGSSYVFATARDYARFGYLYLQEGIWNGKQVLPAGWVDHARVQTVVDDETGLGYGAHWWTLPGEEDSLVASGYEGQQIYVLPKRDLVIVRLGKTVAEKRNAVRESLLAIAQAFPLLQ